MLTGLPKDNIKMPPAKAKLADDSHIKIQADQKPESFQWFKDAAKVLHSRESTYRGLLDVIAWDIPAYIAAASRNVYDLAETVFKSVIGTSLIFVSPKITRAVAETLGKYLLPEEHHKDIKHLMLFSRGELDDLEGMEKG